jgi:energy-coupling factor transporter ATP-binding protein EcfA2
VRDAIARANARLAALGLRRSLKPVMWEDLPPGDAPDGDFQALIDKLLERFERDMAARPIRRLMSALLQVSGISKHFGRLHAVKNVSFTLRSGSITGVLGPNGAGKTTMFNLLTGFIRPDSGTVLFEGRSLVGLAPHQIVNCGVARTFQLARPFAGMSAVENVEVACLAPRVRRAGKPLERAHALLGQVGLGDNAELDADVLPYGDLRGWRSRARWRRIPSSSCSTSRSPGLVPSVRLDRCTPCSRIVVSWASNVWTSVPSTGSAGALGILPIGGLNSPEQTEALRANDRLRARFGRQLDENSLHVGLDRFRGHAQRSRDLLVRLAAGDELDDGPLASAEPLLRSLCIGRTALRRSLGHERLEKRVQRGGACARIPLRGRQQPVEVALTFQDEADRLGACRPADNFTQQVEGPGAVSC